MSGGKDSIREPSCHKSIQGSQLDPLCTPSGWLPARADQKTGDLLGAASSQSMRTKPWFARTMLSTRMSLCTYPREWTASSVMRMLLHSLRSSARLLILQVAPTGVRVMITSYALERLCGISILSIGCLSVRGRESTCTEQRREPRPNRNSCSAQL